LSYAVGALVHARGRDWIVLPDSSHELLILRPMGGTDEDVSAILTAVEDVHPATFPLPDPSRVGDDRSARLLRDALRLSVRSSAGPFRSFGRIAFDPRPYQVVPLLMALRLNPVRLLIADDVGIGKTVEALLVARELVDQASAKGLAVLCPPHLAGQWQRELAEKFHIEAELVLPSTAARLERDLRIDQTIFQVHRFTVVSLDYIKSERRRDEFLRTCPDLVIVDEAHTCAGGSSEVDARHQRHRLVSGLAQAADRHLILVTATPHSGKEEAFRSLVGLLDPGLAVLPDDLSGTANEGNRRRLARHFVQRRRADLRRYMGESTDFPEAEETEEIYKLSVEYRSFLDRVLVQARDLVRDRSGTQFERRLRWWSALALLRSVASSPAAAGATLIARAAAADAGDVKAADEIGRREVLDLPGSDEDVVDMVPGSDIESPGNEGRLRARLMPLAREAKQLEGKLDLKLAKGVSIVRKLLADEFNPIVFCRFIATAEYVARELRRVLPDEVQVVTITGLLSAPEREQRIAEIDHRHQRVLVATDCLSEGINLQHLFDAVLHYDLSWNPTRHEQREGRVDRYGQLSPKVRTITFYGTDNRIDGIVLQVLLRKHQRIKKATGVSVPVPGDPNTVVEAILEGLMLRKDPDPQFEQLVLLEAELAPKEKDLLQEWDRSADRERRSRTMFAQEGIKVDEVIRELAAVRAAIGSGVDVRRFLIAAVPEFGGRASGNGVVSLHLDGARTELREAMGTDQDHLRVAFSDPAPSGALKLSRVHPAISGLADLVLTTAIDPLLDGPASRAGVVRTRSVARRTTLLLLRHRHQLLTSAQSTASGALLAEECDTVAFRGDPATPEWLSDADVDALLLVEPSANVDIEEQRHHARQAIASVTALAAKLDDRARVRASTLQEAHGRARQAIDQPARRVTVAPLLPSDVLGVYVYLPDLRNLV